VRDPLIVTSAREQARKELAAFKTNKQTEPANRRNKSKVPAFDSTNTWAPNFGGNSVIAIQATARRNGRRSSWFVAAENDVINCLSCTF